MSSRQVDNADDRFDVRMTENLPRCIKLDKSHVKLLYFVFEVGISKFKHVACLGGKNSARKQDQSSMHRCKGKKF